MLKTEERETLVSMIMGRLPNSPGTAVVAIYVGDDIAEDLPNLPLLVDVARWIVKKVLEQETPKHFIALIAKVDDGDEKAAGLVDIANYFEAAPADWEPQRLGGLGGVVDWSLDGDPLEVRDGSPFVDRHSFRSLLPRDGDGTTPKCTVVHGEEGSGKSYLNKFCEQYSERSNTHSVGYAEIPSSRAPSYTPKLAAYRLALALKTDFHRKPRDHEDPHRYARNLASWLAEYTPLQEVPAIAIFDGFDDPRVSEPVHTFVTELVGLIDKDKEVARRLRVILLGYDTGRLEELDIPFESCVLEFVGREHIEDWFRKRYPDRPDYQYEDTAADIAEWVSGEDDTARMSNLCLFVAAAKFEFEN